MSIVIGSVVRVYYENRNSPIILLFENDADENPVDAKEEVHNDSPPPVIMLTTTTKLPNTFLGDPEWIKSALANIKDVFNIDYDTVDQSMQDRADLVGKLLIGRLEKHIQQKIHNTSKHDHWCIIFVRDNLNRFAALIVFFKHATIHPHSVTEMSSLLRKPNKKSGYIFVTYFCLKGKYATSNQINPQQIVTVTNTVAIVSAAAHHCCSITNTGCYLFYDLEERQWIIRRKAVGSDISKPCVSLKKREARHHKAAKT